MDLIKLLTTHQTLAQEKLQQLGGNNDYFRGYLMAIGHAIELAKIQAWRIELGLPITQQEAR